MAQAVTMCHVRIISIEIPEKHLQCEIWKHDMQQDDCTLYICLQTHFTCTFQIKSNQIFICSNERSQKIDNNSDNEHNNKAQEALTAALVNNSKINTRNS